MPAPWVAGAQGRILGEIHGQQTVNVLNFGTNSAIADQGALDPPVEFPPHPLKVGSPRPFGLVVGVADVVTDGAPFSAD